MKGLLLHNTLVRLTFYLLLLYPLYSQVSDGGDPKSIQAGLTDDIPQVIMPLVDRAALLREDKIEMEKDVPYRFGTPFEVQYNLNNSGNMGRRIKRANLAVVNQK